MARVIPIFVLIAICCPAISYLGAQSASDLYLFQLYKSHDLKYHVAQPKFLSGFNPGGYTNQPWFTSTGDLLVSVRLKHENQNDIFQLSPPLRKIKQITRTTWNEFSPRSHPNAQDLTVLRQVEGDSIDQQVVRIDWKGGGWKSIIPAVRNIGYYTWIKNNALGLFKIDGESNQLVYHELEGSKSLKIASAIGRTLLTDSRGSVIYVHKFSDQYWYIKKYNPSTASIDIIIETPGQHEDFTLTPDGTYLIGAGSKLFYFHPDHHASWQELSDLSMYGIKRISRLAVSQDGRQLALVATPP